MKPSPYLEAFRDSIDLEAIQQLQQERQQQLTEKRFDPFREAIETLPPVKAQHQVLDQAIVTLGEASELDEAQHESLLKSLQAFIPWRKGPFSIFGHEVDAEWRSDWKWERVSEVLDDLEGKRIADIGCNNGYYLFRMAAQKPELVIGLDPTVRFYYHFKMLQHFSQIPSLQFELLGVEHMSLFPSFFDVVFCMGILYHHPDPIGLLRGILKSMKPGGQLIIESQGIPGEEPIALFPEKRYAGVVGNWFIPTISCLQHWIRRAGFSEVNLFFHSVLSKEEQRCTEWAPYRSLSDYLDPSDPSQTQEGYPAPIRIYVMARK